MVSEFHLQARRLVGSLARPERDETRLFESDSWSAICAEACRLGSDGFTIWVFRYGVLRGPALAAYGLRLITMIQPGQKPPPTAPPTGDS